MVLEMIGWWGTDALLFPDGQKNPTTTRKMAFRKPSANQINMILSRRNFRFINGSRLSGQVIIALLLLFF
jgi:hypothetical protein